MVMLGHGATIADVGTVDGDGLPVTMNLEEHILSLNGLALGDHHQEHFHEVHGTYLITMV